MEPNDTLKEAVKIVNTPDEEKMKENLMQAATLHRTLYAAYIEKGFTPVEALILIGYWIQGMVKK